MSHRKVTLTGWHPPLPTTTTSGDNNKNNHVKSTGQRLQYLVRRLLPKQPRSGNNDPATCEEHQESHNSTNTSSSASSSSGSCEDWEEATMCLQHLTETCRRHGLLQGNVALAQTVCNSATATATTSGGKLQHNTAASRRNSPNKRSRQSNDLTIVHDETTHSIEQDGLDGPSSSSSSSSCPTTTLDVHLIMTALTRILSLDSLVEEDSGTKRTCPGEDTVLRRRLLIHLAANVCIAQCEFLATTSNGPAASGPNNRNSHNTDSAILWMAEYELLASSGKAILAGLEHIVRQVLGTAPNTKWDDDTTTSKNDTDPFVSSQLTAALIVSCLDTATALVGLFGTKLARSGPLLSSLAEVAWDAMMTMLMINQTEMIEEEEHQQHKQICSAACSLLSTLSLVSSSFSSSPSGTNAPFLASWEDLFHTSMACLALSLKTVAPITQKKAQEKIVSADDNGGRENQAITQRVDWWLHQIRECPDEQDRVNQFLSLVQGLGSLLACLLQPVSVGSPGQSASSHFSAGTTVSIHLASCMDLIETMISFSLACESTYLGTRKRLRQEVVSHGLISATSLAEQVANRIKLCGMELLELLIQQLGCPTLLPFSHEIKRVAVAALQTSVSTTLRAALDPTSTPSAVIPTKMLESGQGGRKKRKLQQHQQQYQEQKRPESASTQRWLHSSIAVRCAAVKLFRTTVLAFGVDYASPQGEQHPPSLGGQTSDMSRGISMVSGCLVEQLAGPGRLDDWGAAAERLHLVMHSSQALSACLLSGGEFLPISARTMIDSIASTCLAALVDEKKSCLPLTEDAKIAFLSLGSACVSTPWPDGASCPAVVVDLLRHAAQYSCDAEDNHSSLLADARATLTLCDHVLSTPRIPALLVVTRASSNNDTVARQRRLDIMSADDLLGRMQRATALRQEADSGATDDPLILKGKSQKPQKSDSSTPVAQEGEKSEDDARIKKGSVHENERAPLEGEQLLTTPPLSVGQAEQAFQKTDVPAETSDERSDKQKMTVTNAPNSTLATDHLQMPASPDDDDLEGGKAQDPEMELKPRDDMYDKDKSEIDNEEDDDDLPMIVDCEPDAGDEDSD